MQHLAKVFGGVAAISPVDQETLRSQAEICRRVDVSVIANVIGVLEQVACAIQQNADQMKSSHSHTVSISLIGSLGLCPCELHLPIHFCLNVQSGTKKGKDLRLFAGALQRQQTLSRSQFTYSACQRPRPYKRPLEHPEVARPPTLATTSFLPY